MTSFRPVAGTLAPLGGAVFVALWTVAEAGRSGLGDVVVLAACLGVAIGLSVWLPAVSLGLVVVLPLLQLGGLAPAVGETTWPMYSALGVVALAVAATGSQVERWVALPAVLIGSAAAVAHMTLPTTAEPWRWTSWTGGVVAGGHPVRDALVTLVLAGAALVALSWAAGFGIGAATRLRRLDSVLTDTEGRLAQTDLELRLGLERSRISRDVHDSVAHALTVVVAQSEGAAALSRRDPEVVAGALAAISGVARDALGDVRGLVERITEPGDELLSLADVPALVERMRGVGMQISLDEHGERPEIRPAQQLTVYRLLQEALTNALKHGGSTGRASIVLDWRGPGLALLVHSWGDAPLVRRASLPGVGAGIAGMRERARLVGGWLTAEPGEDGEFVVTASLPTRPASLGASPRGASAPALVTAMATTTAATSSPTTPVPGLARGDEATPRA